MHIGLPQWQYLFTDIGPTPQALVSWVQVLCGHCRLEDSGSLIEMTQLCSLYIVSVELLYFIIEHFRMAHIM